MYRLKCRHWHLQRDLDMDHLELATISLSTTTTQDAPNSVSLLNSYGSNEEDKSETGSYLNNKLGDEIQAYFAGEQNLPRKKPP